jgi:hypothetical protein
LGARRAADGRQRGLGGERSPSFARRSSARRPPAGEDEYAFRHALVRDAAYAMLTDADRTAAHVLAGIKDASTGAAPGAVVVDPFVLLTSSSASDGSREFRQDDPYPDTPLLPVENRLAGGGWSSRNLLDIAHLAWRYAPTMTTNPIHVLAAQILHTALSSVGAGLADLPTRFMNALQAAAPHDPAVLATAIKALEGSGYALEEFNGPGGFMNLQAAVQASIRQLQSRDVL